MKPSVKIFFKTFILTVFAVLLVGFYYSPLPSRVTKIKVFFEVYATSPVLWESVEFVKAAHEKNVLKVFFFHRYPNRAEIFDLSKINAIEASLEAGEGLWIYHSEAFIKRLKKIADRYPKAQFEIYSNINQTRYFLLQLIKEFPSRIEHIHLYEDGACNIIGNEYAFWQQFQPHVELLRDFEKNPNFFSEIKNRDVMFWKASIGKLAPATYHLCRADEIIKDKKLKTFVEWIGRKNIKNISLKSEAARLAPHEKKLLEHFFEIDSETVRALSESKKTIFLTAGYFFDDKITLNQEISVFSFFKNMPARVFLKCHPSYSAKAECDQLHKAFPDYKMIKPQIPVEAFFLTGHEPDYVSGYSSSLYFLIPPEKILFLRGSSYMKRLMDLGIVTPRQRRLPLHF